MYRLIFSLLLTIGVAFGLTEKERDRLLMLIQGLYKDKIYSLAAQKAEEYLKNSNPDDPYREKVLILQLQAYVKVNNVEKILSAVDKVNNYDFPEETKNKVYSIILKQFENDPDKTAEAIKRILKYTEGYERKQLLQKLAAIYYKNKRWAKILELPSEKEINLLKLISLYKMGRYMDVIKETEKMEKFLPEHKDDVLYYRALAFYKIGRKDKAASYMEAITFKTPEVIKFLVNYYFKKKNYILAERYLYILSTENNYKDYAYYLLGVIADQNKEYEKAARFYERAARFNTKYGKLAKKRIFQLKKAGVIKGKEKSYYSVRVILFISEKKAEKFIEKNNLHSCFTKPFKKYIAVYCGLFETKEEAKKEKRNLMKKGFKDLLIEKIKI
ncbi:tetratricopeptide repeat protein [Persephonella sp.]